MMSVKLHASLLLMSICYIGLSVCTPNNDPPVVTTSTATFTGKRVLVNPRQVPDFQRNVAAYTRIPYAEPPVGNLRYKHAVPKVVSGDFEATREAIACPQAKMPGLDIDMETSEDCLYLDVFVPEEKKSSLAVMVWIHGGGYHVGAGSIPQSVPIPLAAIGDVIVVTINYRLGVLGFLSTGDDEIPANLGMLDQRQALLWVQENIAAFGGDPSRVTIFGESAGSGSVNLHLLSTMSAGLFSGAIMQSGAINDAWSHNPSLENAVNLTFDFGKAMNCDVTTSSELLTCLQDVQVEDIITMLNNQSMAAGLPFFVRPVADGHFLLDDPKKLAAEGSFNPADVINGCLQDEGTIFTQVPGQDPNTKPNVNQSTFNDLISFNLATADPLVINFTTFVYGSPSQLNNPEADYFDSAAQLMGDMLFACPANTMTKNLAQAGRNVYSYIMTHVPSGSMWGKNKTWLAATHGEDIPYVFGSPYMAEEGEEDYFPQGIFNEDEVEISWQMMKYWSNFARTGDPNLPSRQSGQAPDSRYPLWPKYTTLEPAYKELSSSFDSRNGLPHAKECYYLQKLLPTLLENAAEMTRLKADLEEKVKADSEKSCSDPESCPEE